MKKSITLVGMAAVCSLMLSWHPSSESVPLIPEPVQDSLIDVRGKTALFIGDSHTANFRNGWQRQLSDSVGFTCINASVSGKTTYFMLNVAVYKINESVDWCFIYGGANDMYTRSISPQEAVDNIQAIARLCSKRGIKCVVLTGFDPVKCTRTDNPYYAKKYASFQKLLLQGVEGATVVDTRVVERSDCWDALCHMSPSGHAKIAKRVKTALHLASKRL